MRIYWRIIRTGVVSSNCVYIVVYCYHLYHIFMFKLIFIGYNLDVVSRVRAARVILH